MTIGADPGVNPLAHHTSSESPLMDDPRRVKETPFHETEPVARTPTGTSIATNSVVSLPLILYAGVVHGLHGP
jgi:hypothetical protein